MANNELVTSSVVNMQTAMGHLVLSRWSCSNRNRSSGLVNVNEMQIDPGYAD